MLLRPKLDWNSWLLPLPILSVLLPLLCVGTLAIPVPGFSQRQPLPLRQPDLSVFVDAVAMAVDLPAVPPSSSAERPPITLGVQVYNLGNAPAEQIEVQFSVVFANTRTVRIGNEIVPRIEGGRTEKVQLSWRPSVDAAEVIVRIDPRSRIPEINEANNVASKRFVFNTFRVTPAKGSNGTLSSWDGNLSVTLLAGALKIEAIVGIEQIDDLPDLSNQPALQYIPVPGAFPGRAYRISFPGADTTDPLIGEGFSIGVALRYQLPAEENVLLDQIGVYHRDEETQQWNREGVETLGHQDDLVSVQAEHLGLFSVLTSTDRAPPIISLRIDDRQFQYDGEFTSTQPKLTAFVEDDNGVGHIEIQLNRAQVLPENLDRFDKLANGNAALVEYKPILNFGTYLFEVTASDFSGNRITEEIQFEVGGSLQLKAVANRPNPFSSETWFTYVLTQEAAAVRIKIYNTSGRLIYEVPDSTHALGYNEIRWTGIDRNDDPVANGVYFYKVTVIGENKQRITQTHQLAGMR